MRRYFGEELRIQRERLGVSRAELGSVVGYSPETVKSIECGRRSPSEYFSTGSDRYLDMHGAIERLGEAAREDTTPFGELKEHEQRAAAIKIWENRRIPGLLQTEDYAREVVGDEEFLAERLERQQVFDRNDAPRVRVVLCESVIYRRIGTPAQFATQLRWLVEPEVPWFLHVLPLSVGTNPGIDGAVQILEFVGEAPLGYVDGQQFATLVDDPRKVRSASDAFDTILGLAWPPDVSAQMVTAVADQFAEAPCSPNGASPATARAEPVSVSKSLVLAVR